LALFGCADKTAEKHCWLICCERKILFRLKKQAEKRRIISRIAFESLGVRRLNLELKVKH
jgi:hypothetical protein